MGLQVRYDVVCGIADHLVKTIEEGRPRMMFDSKMVHYQEVGYKEFARATRPFLAVPMPRDGLVHGGNGGRCTRAVH
jgi:hypothetical protein